MIGGRAAKAIGTTVAATGAAIGATIGAAGVTKAAAVGVARVAVGAAAGAGEMSEVAAVCVQNERGFSSRSNRCRQCLSSRVTGAARCPSSCSNRWNTKHTHHTISNVLNAAQLFISNADAQMWWIAREARCGPPGHPQKPPAKGAESLATGPKHNRRWRESTSKNRCVYGEERAIGFVRRVDVAFVYMFDWNPPAIALRTRVGGEWLFASFDRIEHSRCVWVTTSAVAWFCYCCWCYGWC
jgi:hypothetical protein